MPDFLVRLNDRLFALAEAIGGFDARTWRRGGWHRLLAVALCPVQLVAWFLLFFIGLPIYLAVLFAGYAAVIAVVLFPLYAVVFGAFWALNGFSLDRNSGGGDGSDLTSGGGSQRTSERGSGFCSAHHCIPSFGEGNGYIVQCLDGEWSHSGGLQGACSYHGGER